MIPFVVITVIVAIVASWILTSRPKSKARNTAKSPSYGAGSGYYGTGDYLTCTIIDTVIDSGGSDGGQCRRL